MLTYISLLGRHRTVKFSFAIYFIKVIGEQSCIALHKGLHIFHYIYMTILRVQDCFCKIGTYRGNKLLRSQPLKLFNCWDFYCICLWLLLREYCYTRENGFLLVLSSGFRTKKKLNFHGSI